MLKIMTPRLQLTMEVAPGYPEDGDHALNFNAIDEWNGDYIYLGDILDFGTISFSYSVRFNARSLNVDWQQNIVSKRRYAGGYKFDIEPNSNVLKPIFAEQTERVFVYSGELSENLWHHATVVVNRDSSEMSLYLDGVHQNTVTIYDPSVDITNIGTLRFAHNHWNMSSDDEGGQRASFLME